MIDFKIILIATLITVVELLIFTWRSRKYQPKSHMPYILMIAITFWGLVILASAMILLRKS